MIQRLLGIALLTMAITIFAGVLYAADQERIYGSQLMTQQERLEYREQLRNAKTVQEREQIRKEHHEKMKARAKARGVKIPDEPPMGGGTMMGPGNGMGSGGGKGGR